MKIVIIGGGIAGSVLSVLLSRLGHDVHIFEAHPPAEEDVGYFLNLASNGIHILRELDLWDEERLDAHRMPRMVFRNGRGKRLGVVANGTVDADGTTSVTVKRAALHRLLIESAQAQGVSVHWERRAIHVVAEGDEVTAVFEDGSRVSAEILIGADGVHSKTRAFVSPNAPEPGYTGILSVAGYVMSGGFEPTPDEMQMLFGRHAFFGHLVRDDGQVYWFANVAAQESEFGDLLERSSRLWKDELTALFVDDDPRVAEIIEATTSPIGAYPIYDIGTVPRWSRHRAVLLGDAAHATSPNAGQGASMALEDAMILGKCLRDESDHQVAFANYERLRRRRAERVVAYSRKLGDNKAISPVAAWFRDLFMPIALKFFASPSAQDWLYSYRPTWQQSVSDQLAEQE